VAIRTDEKLLQHQSCINSQNITFILHTSPTENVSETPPPSKTMPRHFTFSFMGDEPLPAHRSVTISNKKKQTCIQSGSVNNTSQMQRKTPFTADVRPLERSSLTSKSAKTGKVQAPLKDISNTMVPDTVAAPPKVAKKPDAATSNNITAKMNDGKLHLLNQVSSQWKTGKGRSQTSKCLDAIRICLGNDISPADVANHVAKDLEADIQAMEFRRARECAKRISKSMEKQATREGGTELQKKRVTTFEELEEHLKTLKLHPEQEKLLIAVGEATKREDRKLAGELYQQYYNIYLQKLLETATSVLEAEE
jgi:hypothetical protein